MNRVYPGHGSELPTSCNGGMGADWMDSTCGGLAPDYVEYWAFQAPSNRKPFPAPFRVLGKPELREGYERHGYAFTREQVVAAADDQEREVARLERALAAARTELAELRRLAEHPDDYKPVLDFLRRG